jgi:hypothetical protein
VPQATGKPERPFVPWTRPAPGTRELAPGLEIADTGARFAAYAIDLLLLFVVSRVIAAAAGQSGATMTLGTTSASITTVALVAVHGLYCVGSWSGGRRATVGQRLTRIEVGNAFDGRSLSSLQATRRWLAFGSWLLLLNLIPAVAIGGALASSIWNLVLLWTTYTSPVGQGVHDRLAGSALARSEGGVRPVWLVLFAMLAWFIVTVAWTGSLPG